MLLMGKSDIRRNFLRAPKKVHGRFTGSFNTLRHTYCALLAANGNDTKVVQESLRHQSFNVTTDVYMQALSDDQRNTHHGVIQLVVPRQIPSAQAVIIGELANIETAKRPRRLAWPRTSPFHGGNTGSNPVGDANLINNLRNCWFWRTTAYATVKLLDHSTMGIALLFRHSFIVDIHRD